MLDPFTITEMIYGSHVSRDRERWLEQLIPRQPRVRILIVADPSIHFTDVPFGLSKAIEIIRRNVDGYVRFKVDLARLGGVGAALAVRNNPATTEPKYENFRFSSQINGKYVVDAYDEIWCFGIAPNNDSTNDDNIWNSPYASSDDDLAVLTKWMNAGGGMLAMGDHHYLGAAMCARIPRVRSMRRWTNAQDVPSRTGPNRHDTNQPQNDRQDPNVTPTPERIPDAVQEDAVPQKIEWKPYRIEQGPFFRPHAVLCGGRMGVIDVLPDHPHEGCVFENKEIKLTETYQFNGVKGAEYPKVGAYRVRPVAIAWANTLSTPPHNHQKGETPAKRFALIGAYDGDRPKVGRVLVDSTWHHWMNMNLEGLENSNPNKNYRKIERYFRNCAVWLARSRQREEMLDYTCFICVSRSQAYLNYYASERTHSLGESALADMSDMAGPCNVLDWAFGRLPDLSVEELFPPDDIKHGWGHVLESRLHKLVLGGIIREMISLRDELVPPNKKPRKITAKLLSKATSLGRKAGLEEFYSLVEKDIERLTKITKNRKLAIKKR